MAAAEGLEEAREELLADISRSYGLEQREGGEHVADDVEPEIEELPYTESGVNGMIYESGRSHAYLLSDGAVDLDEFL